MQASPEHVDAALEALVSARVEQRLAAARQEAIAEMAEVVMDARRCGRTVMVQAACTGRTAVLTVLVRQSIGAGAHLLLKSDRSVAFLDAASSGQDASLRVLLEWAGEELVRATNSRGANALTLAASNGHVGCVTALLQHSPDVQVAAAATAEGLTSGPPIHKGFTALMAATRSGQPACMRALLAHCPTAQVAAVDARRWSALVTAARHGRVECVALLLAHSPNLQRLDKALSAAARAASKLVAASVTDRAAGAAGRQVPAPAPISAALLPFHRCMELLLAQGAMLPLDAPPEQWAAVRAVVRDLAARALAPQLAAEAAVAAFAEARAAVAACKRPAELPPTDIAVVPLLVRASRKRAREGAARSSTPGVATRAQKAKAGREAAAAAAVKPQEGGGTRGRTRARRRSGIGTP